MIAMVIRMKYPRLKQIRIEHYLTQKQVSQILVCSQNCYSKYERGDREMPLRFWIQLAKYYHVSLDFLAGRTDNRDPHYFTANQ